MQKLSSKGKLIEKVLFSIFSVALLSHCTSSKLTEAERALSETVIGDVAITFKGRHVNPTLGAPLASLENGQLSYGLYANQGQRVARNILPDFSYAGYMGGGVRLPSYETIPVRETLTPVDGDDLPQIQAAINRVSALSPDARGIRGAVLLGAGHYQVSDALSLQTSGVVLRGSGQGKQGTRIIATTTRLQKKESVIKVGQKEKRNHAHEKGPALAANPFKTLITDQYIPVGGTTINVASTEGYRIGDEVSVVRTPNHRWVSDEGIDTEKFGWKAKSYSISFTRNVTAIDGNRLTIDIPMVDIIDSEFGGGYILRVDTSDRIQQVGVENLRIESLYREDVTDLNRAFFGITMGGVENSWVRDVTISVASHGYHMTNGARFNTLQDVAFVDPNFEVRGGYNYGFLMNDGEMNLFQRCYGRKARHTFITGSRVAGPNVFLDCTATEADNDSGPHHRWATGILYDNTQGDELNVQNREFAGSGHGWAGAQNMFWNTDHKTNVVEAPPHAMNWAVGANGWIEDGKWVNEPDGIIESKRQRVLPRSLYLQQLKERLGAKAVENVTIKAQREGEIWHLLKDWRGEYQLHMKHK